MSKLATVWPEKLPLACLAGTGRYTVIATHFREISWEQAASIPLRVPQASALPFGRGLLGVLSYDQFAEAGSGSGSVPRVLRVEAALVYDRDLQLLHIPQSNQSRHEGDVFVDPQGLAQSLIREAKVGETESQLTQLLPTTGDDDYRQQVRQILQDIRAGRYYQLNLLRYFQVRQRLSRSWVAERLDNCAGPFGAWFELPGLSLVSLSPERFVRIFAGSGSESKATIETRPIKGTAARFEGQPEADAKAAADLLKSAKDRAELAIIVDLMRNDLFRVGQPGSVSVRSAGELLSAHGVHHLEAQVQAQLRLPQTLGDMLAHICPGGSITGAPKREVMNAIRAYEGRARGYFMGHAFYLDDHGSFDSSLLIRTLVGSGDGHYEYAAGSGIVIGSDPEAERLEIAAKCQVITGSSTVGPRA
jgi:para-aminobenzoate synthetase component 1